MPASSGGPARQDGSVASRRQRRANSGERRRNNFPAKPRFRRKRASTAIHSSSVSRPKKLRSRVTNGKSQFVIGDGRGAWARRWRDLIEAHVADLGGGAALSMAERSLIKRAATLEIELEQVEGRLSMGKATDLAVYATAASHLRRIFETLGLDRRARDVTTIIDGSVMRSDWSPMRDSG
jgi:hypothetical protein